MTEPTHVAVSAPRPTVVVADDEIDLRALVELAARRAGATVVASVGDGQAALQAIRRWLPDLAVLDVGMPGMSGLQVCESLRGDPGTAHIRVVLVSAAAHDEAGRLAADTGADAYVHKPFGLKALSAQLRSLLFLQAPPR